MPTIPLRFLLIISFLLCPGLAAAQEVDAETPTGDEGVSPGEVEAPATTESDEEPVATIEEEEPAGPVLVLPESQDPIEDSSAEAESELDAMRGLQEQRLRDSEDHTVIGGYGELHYNLAFPEDGESSAGLDLHRLVLFIAHSFGQDVRFYSELEIEHAFAGDGLPGEVGVEQAYVDWMFAGDRLGLRAGVVLVPMGTINQWHEPPIFHGVERPMVDKVVIPTTWREGGVGLFGEPAEGLRFEAYVMSGLDPLGFSASNGLRKGRQQVAKARADGLAFAGRLEYEPSLGWINGLSVYASLAGPNGGELSRVTGVDMAGDPVFESYDLDVPILGLSADTRLRKAGFEARALVAMFLLGDTEELAQASDEDGESLGVSPSPTILGGYAEVAYDVLHTASTEQQLLPFARLEYYDTSFGHPTLDGELATVDVVLGLSYRPIPQLVFKGDVGLRMPDQADRTTLVNLGAGWMF